jgi:hypothetical protein
LGAYRLVRSAPPLRGYLKGSLKDFFTYGYKTYCAFRKSEHKSSYNGENAVVAYFGIYCIILLYVRIWKEAIQNMDNLFLAYQGDIFNA